MQTFDIAVVFNDNIILIRLNTVVRGILEDFVADSLAANKQSLTIRTELLFQSRDLLWLPYVDEHQPFIALIKFLNLLYAIPIGQVVKLSKHLLQSRQQTPRLICFLAIPSSRTSDIQDRRDGRDISSFTYHRSNIANCVLAGAPLAVDNKIVFFIL